MKEFDEIGDLVTHACMHAYMGYQMAEPGSQTRHEMYGRYTALYEILQMYTAKTGDKKWLEIMQTAQRDTLRSRKQTLPTD